MIPEIKWLLRSEKHAGMWWNPGCLGYTVSKELAGRYTFDEALEITLKSNKHTPIDSPNTTMVPEIV